MFFQSLFGIDFYMDFLRFWEPFWVHFASLFDPLGILFGYFFGVDFFMIFGCRFGSQNEKSGTIPARFWDHFFEQKSCFFQVSFQGWNFHEF
jgi:hypothetical protein